METQQLINPLSIVISELERIGLVPHRYSENASSEWSWLVIRKNSKHHLALLQIESYDIPIIDKLRLTLTEQPDYVHTVVISSRDIEPEINWGTLRGLLQDAR
ncbi:MAG: hypothetical protein JWP89_6931 [Schlesneria sp.]|nr:hypothetical protein [Schlesneria sp.]